NEKINERVEWLAVGLKPPLCGVVAALMLVAPHPSGSGFEMDSVFSPSLRRDSYCARTRLRLLPPVEAQYKYLFFPYGYRASLNSRLLAVNREYLDITQTLWPTLEDLELLKKSS